jgi:uncharacterized tellurite resistance protein B-like protein
MNEQLTTDEKYAIVYILSQIMIADGIIHPKEEVFMNSIYCQLGISINDLENITNLEDILAINIINKMSITNRRYAHSLFTLMAEADGYVHPREIETINKFIKV